MFSIPSFPKQKRTRLKERNSAKRDGSTDHKRTCQQKDSGWQKASPHQPLRVYPVSVWSSSRGKATRGREGPVKERLDCVVYSGENDARPGRGGGEQKSYEESLSNKATGELALVGGGVCHRARPPCPTTTQGHGRRRN